jgi:hypothetical protein
VFEQKALVYAMRCVEENVLFHPDVEQELDPMSLEVLFTFYENVCFSLSGVALHAFDVRDGHAYRVVNLLLS